MARAHDQCIRCGKPTAWDRSVCRQCNPAGLPEPSRTQYHATVFIVVLVVLAALVVAALIAR
ncbi:MAG TPA: hypothetical protein VH442_07350 [Micromonosporaceae bacterium]|jgi:predicted nucleic acid-binding Zn ribbon protein